jgi:ABC-type transport system involved in multi-copper enzyme maturation permease subunit
MRNPQAYTILTTYLSVICGIALLIYVAAATSSTGGVNDSSRVGSVLFYTIITTQLILVCTIVPWFTASAISGEREMNTLDLLQLTPLLARHIVLGKFISTFCYALVLIFATLPLLSLALLLGGVDVTQVLAADLVICATAFLFACLGLYISSRTKTVYIASILTYVLVAGITIGIAIMTLMALPLFNATLYHSSTIVKTSPWLASTIQVAQTALLSLSPLSALIATESNLQSSGNLYAMTINPIPGTTSPIEIPAPFLLTSLFYLLGGTALLWLTYRRLRRPSSRD